MSEYQGYTIERDPESGRWEVFWEGKKQGEDFEREAEAEDWIDDQFPLNR